jgi:hypothetical protein
MLRNSLFMALGASAWRRERHRKAGASGSALQTAAVQSVARSLTTCCVQTLPGIRWSRLYDLKGTADDKVLLQDGAPLPEVRR